MSEFKLYVGPMASGKSLRLIDEYHELFESGLNVTAYKPKIEKRDNGIQSRSRKEIKAVRIKKFSDMILGNKMIGEQAILADEVFMMHKSIRDTQLTVKKAIQQKVEIRLGTLDYSAMGKEMRVFSALKELGPEIIYCSDAKCDFRNVCGNQEASRTLIYNSETKKPIRTGLPELVPEDPNNPTHGYSPVCIECFEGMTSERAIVNYLKKTRSAA